jgi:hypothetical protein
MSQSPVELEQHLSHPRIKLITTNNVNYLGLDTRKLNSSFLDWAKSILPGKQDTKSKPVQYTFGKSQAATWITEDTSERTKIKRSAYIALYQGDNSERTKIKRSAYIALYQGDNSAQISLDEYDETAPISDVLKSLSSNNIEEDRIDWANSKNPVLKKLVKELKKEDARVFNSFVRTLSNANPTGLVGLLTSDSRRNENLSNILSLFTLLYKGKAEENPLLYKFQSKEKGAQDYLVGPQTNDPQRDRKAVINYMEKIGTAIKKIIAMSPQELEMTFPEDDVKHTAIVQKLKRAYNRLSDEIDYGFRFENPINGYDKSNQYQLTAKDHSQEAQEKLNEKLKMRKKKFVIFLTAAAIAMVIAAGQVAIAMFAATGTLAVAIGIACAITNTLLFWRDVKGVMTAFVKGDLFTGMSTPLVIGVGVFFGFSMATGVVSGGFAMSSLLALAGFTFATAPALALIATGFVAALTIVGMTSMFFMAGVALAKALRGKTFAELRSEAWVSLKNYFDKPDYNHEIVKLNSDIVDLKAAFQRQQDGGVRELNTQNEILQKEKQFVLLKWEHNIRHWTKIIFTPLLVLAAIVATGIVAFAVSKSSVQGTRDMIQTALKWSAAASTTVAMALCWVPGFAVNFILTARNLTNVSKRLWAKVAQGVAGTFYGVGMLGVTITSGRFVQTVRDMANFYWANPLKNVVIPGGRLVLGLGVLVLILLNGYGNGATLGQQGAFSLEWLPTKMLEWLKSVAPDTMNVLNSNWSSVTSALGMASSDALNIGAVSDFSMDYSILSAPIMALDNKEEGLTYQEMLARMPVSENPVAEREDEDEVGLLDAFDTTDADDVGRPLLNAHQEDRRNYITL